MALQENRRILIIDDNESIHADFRKILGASGPLTSQIESAAAALFDDPQTLRPATTPFEIDSAYQGQEGLARVQQALAEGRPYALAFVDVRMPPGWDGVEAVRRIWELDHGLQVVICTAYSDYSWAEMIAELGEADGLLILKKPFDNIEVRQLAWALVAKWNLAKKANSMMRELQEKVNQQTRALRTAHDETVYRLVRASLCRDEETGAHIRRTGLCSELLAAAAGWPPERIEQLRLAAPMHDVGKIGIPDAILRKKGGLTPEELDLMRAHTVLGANMLAGSESPVLWMARDIAMYHHERWDGTGYPSGLAGEEIPEAARIVAIVDVYDALTHGRAYRDELPEPEVLKMMQEGRGTHFDPRLLDIFMSLLPEMRAIAQSTPDEAGLFDVTSARIAEPPRDGRPGASSRGHERGTALPDKQQ
jgi:putative two-component system response regulator